MGSQVIAGARTELRKTAVKAKAFTQHDEIAGQSSGNVSVETHRELFALCIATSFTIGV